ncbi:MAG: hypothetical protein ACI4RG_06925 [Huintestinicola sp.]
MSSQLYLIFRSDEECRAIREKYGPDDIRTEIIPAEKGLEGYTILAYYGEGSLTDGFGEMRALASENRDCVKLLLNGRAAEADERSAERLTSLFRKSVTILENIARWSAFLRENIVELGAVGFLIHYDCSRDFSDVSFDEKHFKSLTFEDMLSLKENTVLWVTYP